MSNCDGAGHLITKCITSRPRVVNIRNVTGGPLCRIIDAKLIMDIIKGPWKTQSSVSQDCRLAIKARRFGVTSNSDPDAYASTICTQKVIYTAETI